MIALALAVLVAAQANVDAAAWCQRAMPLATAPDVDGADANEAFEALALAMPREATAVVARARELAGEAGLVRSMAVLRFAVLDTCAGSNTRAASEANDALAAQAAALMANDPRFSGVRKGDGTFDRLFHKAYLWFVALFESEAMQKYAGGSRVVFLSLIALGALALIVITLRKRRAAAKAPPRGGDNAERNESARKEAYASLRAQADALLARGDARASLRAGDAALLARVGELDDVVRERAAIHERVVTAARTHREIAARLPAHVREVVRAPFATFDALFFGQPSIDVDDARAFLAAVDAAEARLVAARSDRSASERSVA